LLQSLSENDQLIYRFLKENGASFASDIEDGTNLSSIQLSESLSRLALISIISCDDYDAFLSLLQSNGSSNIKKKTTPTHTYHSPYRNYQANRRMLRKKISQRLQVKSGRWFLTSSFAVSGKSLDLSSKAEKQTRILLQRYGILVKEWYRREQGFLPWYQIFQTLKRLEWQGEIYRGYFIEGLSGIQFALPQAVDMLQRINSGEIIILPPTMISTVDPALPFGGHVDWDSYDGNNKKVTVTRNPGNHIIFIQGRQVCYCENYASKIFTLKSFNKSMLPDIINQIKSFLLLSSVLRPRKRISIEFIDNKIAIESQFAKDFLSSGFEQEGKKLVLWPSGV
jgi:ATP-dependent Lhr-like helicase